MTLNDSNRDAGNCLSAKYVVGIDLGTTNSEMAYCSLSESSKEYEPSVLKVPQFVEQGIVEPRLALPSCLYVGDESERESADWRLPWNKTEDSFSNDGSDSNNVRSKKGVFKKVFEFLGGGARQEATTNPNALYLVGEIAKRRAPEFSDRVILSAKSWLSYSKVDRRLPFLPCNAPDDYPKASPVEASRRYLKHLADAWNYFFTDAPIYEQLVVLTVPASFDESARELTREAAIGAGINPSTTLFLEEPQAALYAWLARRGDSWRRSLAVGDVIFVCDVGGGTTDFSLIRVEDENGDLVLNRLAVGERLLLGGDNIDLALAFRASELFAEQKIVLNPWQSGALVSQCRAAKEALLSSDNADPDANESYKISILGRSSKVIGGSASVQFPKRDAFEIAVEGFFPLCNLSDRPRRRSGVGLRETGLPYEADPAVSKHIAKFLDSRRDEDGGAIVPTKYLLNGGVFKSKALSERVRLLLQTWFPDSAPTNLDSDADLDCSVACGAAFYGAVKSGGGVRIRGASPRSYYVGFEASGLAIPGVSRPIKALCVAPAGMEEGSERDVPSDAFELVVGEPAIFRFFSSASRPDDVPGTVLEYNERLDDESELEETDSIEVSLDSLASGSEQSDSAEYVMVRFHSVITELGALEIWCEEVDGDRKWKLEFSVRDKSES